MTDLLTVSLASWIIQDGNYGDFKLGNSAAFALEFLAPTKLDEVDPERQRRPSLISVGDARYKVLGQVVHVADDWWVIDVGPLVYSEEKPPRNVQLGGWMGGEILIGIDPFFYFERLAHQPNAPALIYDWKIEKIEMQTAPRIEVRPRVMERDPARLGWREIAKTNAWEDDDSFADYILHCKRLDGPARRTLTR